MYYILLYITCNIFICVDIYIVYYILYTYNFAPSFLLTLPSAPTVWTLQSPHFTDEKLEVQTSSSTCQKS